MSAQVRLLFMLIVLAQLQACVFNRQKTLADLDSIQIRVDRQASIDTSKDEAIAYYRQFLRSAPRNHPDYNNALKRLADLEMQRGDHVLSSDSLEKMNQARDLINNATVQNQRQADGSYKEAIKLYLNILNTGRRDANTDYTIYQLAKAYETVGEDRQAAKWLQVLLKDYPKSRYRMESEYRLAEISFNLEDYRLAYENYNMLVAYGQKNSHFERAVYMRSWALYKLEQYLPAIGAFVSTLKHYNIKSDSDYEILVAGPSSFNRTVVEDSVRAINLSLSQLKSLDLLHENRKQLGLNHAMEFMLINNHIRYSMTDKQWMYAASVIDAYARWYPESIAAARLAWQRITILQRGKFVKAVFQAREDYIKRYGPGSLFWQAYEGADKEVISSHVKEAVLYLANYYHVKAQELKAQHDFQKADYWYSYYLQLFARDNRRAEYQFLLAELNALFKQDNKALQYYQDAAYGSTGFAKAAEAAYAAVLIFEKSQKQSSAGRERWQREAHRMLAKFPEYKYAEDLRFKLAAQYFNDQQFDKAESLLASAQVAGSRAVKIKRLKAQVAFNKGDYARAINGFSDLLQEKDLSKSERRRVQRDLALALFQVAQSYQTAGRWQSAEQYYKRVLEVSEEKELRDKSYQNLLVVAYASKDDEKILMALNQYVRIFPAKKADRDVVLQYANIYERRKDYVQAADAFSRLYHMEKDALKARELLWHVMKLQQAAGLQEALQASRLVFVERFNDDVNLNIELSQQIADQYLQQKQHKQYRNWLDKLVKFYRQQPKNIDDKSRLMVSSALLFFADRRLRFFEEIQLTIPLNKSLKRKQARLKSTIAAYEKVANLQVADHLAASRYQIAYIYQHFARSLLDSQRPKRMSKDELAEYDLLLEEQAFPFEEKAIAMHEANIAGASKQAYNQWVKKSYQALALLLPARYAKTELMAGVYELVN